MVNQIQKRRDNASIHRPSPSLSLIVSPLSLPFSFIHSFIFILSQSLLPSLPLSFFLSSSFLSLPHFLPVVPENRNRLRFRSLQVFSRAFNFGGGSSRLRCHGDCTVPQLQSPKQCRANGQVSRPPAPPPQHFPLLMGLVASNGLYSLTPTIPLSSPPLLLFLLPSTSLIY